MVIRLKRSCGEFADTSQRRINYQQIFWLLLLCAAYFLRDIVKLPMPDLIFTGLCGIAFLLLPTGSAMGVYIFTSALTVPDFEVRLVYLAVLMLKFWQQHKKLKLSMLLVTLAMALLELLNMTLFSSGSFADAIYDVGFRLTYFALPLFWFSEDYSAEDYRRALLCYVAGVFLGGAVMLWISVETVGWEVLLNEAGIRLGMNTAADYVNQSGIKTGYNANQLGGMFAIAVATLLAFIDQKHIAKIYGFVLIPVALFMILLTKSREAALLILGITAVYYYILFFHRKRLLSGVIFVAVAVALVYGTVMLFPEVADSLMNRFQDESNRTGGRDELFVLYMKAWMENIWVFLFGYGIGSYPQMVDIYTVPHNVLTDILISWGIAGLILVLFVLVVLFKQTVRYLNRDIRILAFLPALVALVAVFAGQYLSTGYPHMRLCFLILAAKALESPAPKSLNLEIQPGG